jgi:STE24 endopeptidase
MSNIYLIIILIIFLGTYLLHIISDVLNLQNISHELPDEFIGFYDSAKYKKSQEYLKENTLFSLVKDSLSTALIIPFILFGGFNTIDQLARNFGYNYIATGLIFMAILVIITQLLGLPFDIYSTFVVEKKYEFNKTTIKTFILDRIKILLLSAILGSLVLSSILWFFTVMGPVAWLISWLFITCFQLILYVIAPIWIMPLFNKFEKLEDGELKEAIKSYAASQQYSLEGIYKMDGSKRSTKTNAFFTGFGKFRRIVLFDTLIEKHTNKELLAIIGHEMGHYKKKHIYKSMFVSIISTGLMLFIFSQFINNPHLFAAFKMQDLSIYCSLVFFGFLYSPIEIILGIFSNLLSRKYEYQADEFAAETLKEKEPMILALKKLSVENLSNLTPHKLKVFLEYSHPPVLQRIKALSK